MKERHPVDDLFSHALREAEADPPQAVWNGIVRQRDRRHLALLFLRRRWGILAAVLVLLGGTASYWALPENPVGEQAEAVHAARTNTGNRDTAKGPIVPTSTPMKQHVMIAESISGPQNDLSQEAPALREVPSPAISRERYHMPVGRLPAHRTNAQRVPPSDAEPLMTMPDTGHAVLVMERLPLGDASLTPVPDAVGSRRRSPNDNAFAGVSLAPDTPERAHEIRPMRLFPMRPVLNRPLAAGDPDHGPEAPYVRPKATWWVAVEAAEYREARTWHGGEQQLAEALNGTEVPHPLWSLGVLVGTVGHAGWGISTGIEYCAARYDFRHVDHVLAPTDSLVAYVVTLNTEVVASYTDTVTVVNQEQHPVSVVNHYSTVHVPIEASWQNPWGRWKYGLRAGLGFDFNTLRSGATLVNSGTDTRSVDVDASPSKRTAVLMTGSIAADLGYVLGEGWEVWASPAYATGLFPLSPSADSPYAMPDRLGLRVRLCHTLRPRQ